MIKVQEEDSAMAVDQKKVDRKEEIAQIQLEKIVALILQDRADVLRALADQ